MFDGIDREANEIAAIVKGPDLYVRRQNAVIQFLRLFFHAGENVLRLLAAQHQDHAFDGIVIFLEAEFSEARSAPDGHFSDITHANRHAIIVSDDDITDIVGVGDKPQAAHIEKLRALRR